MDRLLPADQLAVVVLPPGRPEQEEKQRRPAPQSQSTTTAPGKRQLSYCHKRRTKGAKDMAEGTVQYCTTTITY